MKTFIYNNFIYFIMIKTIGNSSKKLVFWAFAVRLSWIPTFIIIYAKFSFDLSYDWVLFGLALTIILIIICSINYYKAWKKEDKS